MQMMPLTYATGRLFKSKRQQGLTEEPLKRSHHKKKVLESTPTMATPEKKRSHHKKKFPEMMPTMATPEKKRSHHKKKFPEMMPTTEATLGKKRSHHKKKVPETTRTTTLEKNTRSHHKPYHMMVELSDDENACLSLLAETLEMKKCHVVRMAIELMWNNGVIIERKVLRGDRAIPAMNCKESSS